MLATTVWVCNSLINEEGFSDLHRPFRLRVVVLNIRPTSAAWVDREGCLEFVFSIAGNVDGKGFFRFVMSFVALCHRGQRLNSKRSVGESRMPSQIVASMAKACSGLRCCGVDGKIKDSLSL